MSTAKNSPRIDIFTNFHLKAIQKLKKKVAQIESVKNRGYRLTTGDLLIPDWIMNTHLFRPFNPDCLSTQMDAKAGAWRPDARPTLLSAAANLLAVAARSCLLASVVGGFATPLHLKLNLPSTSSSYTILTTGAIYKAAHLWKLISGGST